MTATSSPADRTPAHSTAIPKTIEGEPAMTTTTSTTAPNTGPDTPPEEPTGPDIAPGAGTEQRETEHVDPAATGSARAGTAEDNERAHQLASPGRRGAQGPAVPTRAPTPRLPIANSSPAAPVTPPPHTQTPTWQAGGTRRTQ